LEVETAHWVPSPLQTSVSAHAISHQVEPQPQAVLPTLTPTHNNHRLSSDPLFHKSPTLHQPPTQLDNHAHAVLKTNSKFHKLWNRDTSKSVVQSGLKKVYASRNKVNLKKLPKEDGKRLPPPHKTTLVDLDLLPQAAWTSVSTPLSLHEGLILQ
jgi:hypothetical protein